MPSHALSASQLRYFDLDLRVRWRNDGRPTVEAGPHYRAADMAQLLAHLAWCGWQPVSEDELAEFDGLALDDGFYSIPCIRTITFPRR